MAGSISIPNVFQTQAGLVPASQLDTNWNTIRDYVNTREVSSGTLAARPTAPSGGTWYFATDDNGGTLYFSASTGWVRAATGLSGSTTLTAPLTLSDATAGGITHPFLDYVKTGTDTWRTYFDRPALWGSSATLIFTSLQADHSLLRLAFPAMNGGMRMYLWDSVTTVAPHAHTNTLPAFAVAGDITVGDIVTFSPAGNAWIVGGRTATGLVAATDITHIQCASQPAGNDANGGATIDLYPTQDGAGISDGIVELQAYGRGSGALANHILFATRGGVNTVTRRWGINSTTLLPQADVTYDIGNSAARVRAVYTSQVLASAGNSNTLGFVPAMIGMNAAAGTGSPGDTNENNLKTYQVPNNALATNGDVLKFTATFRCAANATTKRIRVYFGATTIIDSTALAFNNARFTITGWIARTGPTAQTAHTQAFGHANGGAWDTNVLSGMELTAPAATLSTSVLLRCTVELGAGAALNDVIQDMMLVEYLRSA